MHECFESPNKGPHHFCSEHCGPTNTSLELSIAKDDSRFRDVRSSTRISLEHSTVRNAVHYIFPGDPQPGRSCGNFEIGPVSAIVKPSHAAMDTHGTKQHPDKY